MGRTLRNIIAGSLIAGTLLFGGGCGNKVNLITNQITGEKDSYEKAVKIVQNPSSVLTGGVVKETKQKTIDVGIAVLTDVNVKPTFYKRLGKHIDGKDIYTTDWEEYDNTQEKGKSSTPRAKYLWRSDCSVSLKDLNSFVEIKAIVTPSKLDHPTCYDKCETKAYRFDWNSYIGDPRDRGDEPYSDTRLVADNEWSCSN